jgi:hypothetical protein
MALARPGSPNYFRFAAVISSTRNPVYAKQKLSPPRPRAVAIWSLFLAIVFLCAPTPSRADALEDGARALAHRVSLALQGDLAWLNPKNRSSLRETELKKLASVFKNELQQRGAKIASAGGSAEIVLTVSDCPTGYLGVAEIRRATRRTETLIGSLGRADGAGQDRSQSGLVLRKELLFSQERPLIDAAFQYSLPIIDTLGQGEYGHYELNAGRWTPAATDRLPLAKPLSRDMRGRLGHSVDAMGASYFTENCRLESGSWHCENGKGIWQPPGVGRDLLEEKRTPPWFSAAEFKMSDKEAIIITGKDGLARLYSQGPEPIYTFPGWGSEIASIQSGCGNGWQILVTGKGDWTTPDSVQAFEVGGDQLQEMTPAIDFPGPVLGLHLSGSSPQSTTDGALAIVRNLFTGRYEVYVLTINCAH